MNKNDSFSRWRPHPWHGLEVGPNPPNIVHAYIEITPFDTVKYEVDKLWDKVEDLPWVPQVLVERLKHYFSTYKLIPGQEKSIWIENLYGRDRALEVVNAAMEDYLDLLGKSVGQPGHKEPL
ncbi:MAG TPA: inorganic diphosphatase [Smithellaceae bacterium]|nr:inorganic diphosphatase [Smithellaceae bacterium]